MSDMHHSFKNSVDKTEDTTKRNSLEELVELVCPEAPNPLCSEEGGRCELHR